MARKGKQRPPKAVRFGKTKKDESEIEIEEAEQDHEEGEDDLSLDDVMRLGGTKADFVMLAGIEDKNELVNGGKKNAIDDLEDGELEAFIKKLGIQKYAEEQIINDDSDDRDEAGEPKQPEPKEKPAVEKESKEQEQVISEPEKAPAVKQEKESKKKKKQTKQTNSTVAAGKKAKKNATVFDFFPRQVLLVKPGGKWFDVEYTSESNVSRQDESLVAQYKDLAQKLFAAEVEVYKTKKSLQKGANTSWMKSVVSAGTLVDRMAAMTVLVQDAPVHCLEHIQGLVALVKKKGSRRQGHMAVDTLKELLVSDLLPENRKLRTFAQRPFDELEERASGNRDARDRRLILWYFEHQLKILVADFVEVLNTWTHDSVLATKTKALSTAHELLCNRPEQERELLIHVVNKLGDPDYKVASKASYLLELLLHRHPNMKVVVCTEVERLMFRNNVNPKAQYYATCFLNQILLSREESDLATRLITIYFTFFRSCVKKKEVESKMLSALLTGVNRAYPYTKAGDEKVREQLDTLFKVVHVVKFGTALQALMLLFQVMDSQQTVSDRYYVALYKKMLDPGLLGSSRQNMFLNLLYKSLKADIVLRRVKAFVKRLLQVSCELSPSFACGALFLVSEIMKAKPGLKLLLQEEGGGEDEIFQDLKGDDDEDDDEEERFVDADKVEEAQSGAPEQPKPTASWVHHQNLEGGKNVKMYDPTHRNPLYCGADHTTLWELQKLSFHFHPSVALFAKTILQGEHIQYTGDPLQDFTLIRFLDRFVFRNPKQVKGKQNTEATAMQPKHKQTMNSIRSLPVNCEKYLAKEESQIPVDEVFFYRFFKKREAVKKKKPQKRDDEDSVEDVDDDEFDRMLDTIEGDSYFTDFKDDELDFASNVKNKPTSKKSVEDSDSDLDSDDDLDDEEVSLGSMNEEDFGDNLEEDGGEFMDPQGDDDDDDEVPELEMDDDFEDNDDDEGDSFNDIEEDMEEPEEVCTKTKKGKRKLSEQLDFSESFGAKSGKKKKAKINDKAMFASAEEFGDLLDENVGSKFDSTGMNAMANKDKASVKQLKWEAQRDDWIRGRDVKSLRRKKTMFKKRKPIGKARPGKKAMGKKN